MIKEIIGKTIVLIEGLEVDSEEIIFSLENGDKYKMYHDQDCCESVYIEDVNGKIDNLLNSPVLRFDEKSEDNPNANESGTYTFYTIATKKGYIDIRWNGESNGYYSESVDFEKI